MTNFFSPLRYPGGKGALSNFLTSLLTSNNLLGKPYFELYAGGAGAALTLLFNKHVSRIHINDADYRIYAFWYSILNHTESFLEKIDSSPVDMTEWQLQKMIYENAKSHNIFDVGYATFFLNRTNRSGILFKSGPIGGLQQNSKYTLDVRFNKENLKCRISLIASHKEKITITNAKAEELLINGIVEKESFTYLDPPYYNKGRTLYLNNYTRDQHVFLSEIMKRKRLDSWMISYDNIDKIREMYKGFRMSTFALNYSLQSKKQGSELIIFSDGLNLPTKLQFRKQELNLLELDSLL